MDWQALRLSLLLASSTTLALLIVNLPIAYWISGSRGKFALMIEALVSLPLVLPPTVLGFYLLLILSRLTLAFTFTGLLVSSVIYSFPFALQPILSSFQSIEPQLLEISWTLGESRTRTFWRIGLPMAFSGILSGAILTFAHTLGEFGVILMIGGNIPGVTRTLSVALYDQVEALDYSSAHHTAIFLLALSFTALLITSLIRKKVVSV